jgi:hypothetical protein
LYFARSASNTVGTQGALTNGTPIGRLLFQASDGASFLPGAYIQAAVDGPVSIGITPTDLTFFTQNTSGATGERLRILGNGNIGIGTTTPDQKLTVNGQVHSTSVVVTSTVPADYVFNTNYHLRPLTEVKAFVDKNHHLPEVPSAADFNKDGQNLGEMNMLLLKKVEELTLYLIEKDKQLAEQKTINQNIQQQLKDLAGQLKDLKSTLTK